MDTKVKLIGFMLIVFLLGSCSPNSQKNSNKKENKQAEKTQNNIYTDENLTVTLNDEWNLNKGPNGHKFYTWKIESSGDIYKDIKDQYSENEGEIKEVWVDDLPALTKLKTYQQNETIKERVWLIYNGEDVISFNVMAPLNNYNDKEAMKVIQWVNIKNRKPNVVLPSNELPGYKKPNAFPTKMAEQLKVNFSETAILSEEAIKNAIRCSNNLKEYATIQTEGADATAKKSMPVLDSLAQAHGLASWNNYEKIVKATMVTIDPLLGFMIDLETMDKNTENYKLTLDASQELIKQTNLSLSDLQFVYDNWNLAIELAAALEK